MGYVKRIVCLANSFKIGGSCIAGREVLGDGVYGPWIRPVSDRPTAEVWDSECRYASYAVPKLLDIIDMPRLNAVPHGHQTENYIIENKPWTKVGALPWSQLDHLAEKPAALWINSDSTSAGTFNCISQTEAATLNDSLVLLRQGDFAVEIGSKTWEGKTSKTYRGIFKYNRVSYSLSLTDRIVTNTFASREAGVYPLKDVYLCVSLTEPWVKDNNRCHKLVAAVFTNQQL